MTKFNELRRIYSDNFSLGYINSGNNRSSIENRFVLISLIDYITYKSKLKNPDTTHYEIIMKLSKNLGLPDEFIKGLAIVCEDFSYDCTDFPTFGLKGQDIIKEAISILKLYVPF
jgi:hypothetical protein